MDRFLKIENLIELNILQNIQDSFSKATGVATVTVDYKGDPITKEHGFIKFCKKIREKEELKSMCYKCDALGGVQAAIRGEPYIYKCHMGLVDFAIPIIVNNTYLGAILAGQVKLNEENINLEEICKLSAWDKDCELLEYYNEVKVKTYEEIEASANLMHEVSNYIVEKSFINIIKEDLNNKTQKLEEASVIRIGLEKSLKEEKERKYKLEDSIEIHKDIKVASIEIEKALYYIEKNIKKSITLEDVANHINLSTHYLSKLFKKEIEINFITYLTERKIEIAKEMLLDPNIPIINIAIDLGYQQANYFSKVFKKTVGITPTEYREKYLI